MELTNARSTIVVWAQATAPTRNGTPAWNGTSACCWLATHPPDDEGYVRQLVLDLVEHYRVDPSRARVNGIGGTGLGLAIAKHVLSRHNATLSIRSEPGQGSTFSADFPPAEIRQRTVPRTQGRARDAG